MEKYKTQIKDIRSISNLPTLLFWQYVVIAIAIGIIATRSVELAFFLALFLMLFMAHTSYRNENGKTPKDKESGETKENKEACEDNESKNSKNKYNFSHSKGIWKPSFSFLLRITILFLFILIAFFYATWRNPLLTPDETKIWDDYNNPMQYMYIEANIHSVQSLPGGRLRLLLKDVQPLMDYENIASSKKPKYSDTKPPANIDTSPIPSVQLNGTNLANLVNIELDAPHTSGIQLNAPSLPGMLNFTWDKSLHFTQRPMSGQSIIVRTRIRPVYGGIVEYWKDRHIWYNAWLYGNKDIFWIGEASYFATAREKLRHDFIKNIFLPDLIVDNTDDKSFSQTSSPDLASDKLQARAILPALLFGDRFYLTNQTLDLFNGANLLHSLALSGQHLALTGFLAALFVFIIVSARPANLIHISRRKYIIYLSMPLAFAYVLLGSAPLSLLRAFIMLSIAGLFWLWAKVFTLLDCLFFALLCFCIWWPNALFDLGVQLSFTSVFAIALFMPYILIPQSFFEKTHKRNLILTKRLKTKKFQTFSNTFNLKLLLIQRALIKICRAFCTLISVSLIIQICTMPIIISYFGKVSYFFLLNVLWLPILGFIVLPFAAFALIFSYFDSFAQICIEIASYPPYLLIKFLTWLQSQGFNPFLQSLKPTTLTILGFYVIVLLFCYYTLPQMSKRGNVKSRNKENTKTHENLDQIKVKAINAGAIKIKYKKSWEIRLRALFCRLKPLSLILVLGISLLFSGAMERHFTPKNALNFTLFDVGQGQAVLIEGENGRIILDTGGANSPRFNVGRDIVAHALTQNKAPILKYVIASHDDADHINGLEHLIGTFSINSFMENYLPPSSKQQEYSATRKRIDEILERTKLQTMTLGMGDVIDVGDGFYLQVLYPPYPLEKTKQLIPENSANHASNTSADTIANTNAITSMNKNESAKKDENANKNESKIANKNATGKTKLAKPRNRYSSNNGSLVMRLVKDGKGLALICGDVENTVLKDLLEFQNNNMWTYNTNSPHRATLHKNALQNTASQNGALQNGALQSWSLKAKILVLPHHGSKNSYLPEFYEAVNPQTILASSGRYNRFGFPAIPIINYFEKQNKEVLSTAKEGHIHFSWNGKNLVRQ